MKYLSKFLVAAGVILGLSAVSGLPVNAQGPTCDNIVITNTGPNSNNQGTCTVNVSAKVVCNNNIYVLDSNSQTAVTGTASSLGSTSAGSAISGSATNENNQAVQIGANCGPAPEVPSGCTSNCGGGGGGGGGGAPEMAPGSGAAAPVMPVMQQQVTELPYTANLSPLVVAAATIAIATIVALAARASVALYSHLHTRLNK